MTTYSPAECRRLLELRRKAYGATITVVKHPYVGTVALTNEDAGSVGQFLQSAHSLADQLEAAMGVVEDTKEELTDVRERAEYYEQEAKDLRAHVAKLERGEFICRKCGLRKDGEYERGDF